MVRQLEREVIHKYTWLERANITSGYGVNLLFDFADLDELCKDIEGELDSKSIGAGFLSQGQRIDEFAEHRCSLLTYINDVLYDIDNYLEDPLYKGFNEAVDIMATIDMTDGKTDNTLGVQKNVTVNGGGRGYGFEVEMPELNLEDFIGSRYEETSGSSYERSTYNQKVDDFADLFAKDYEDLVNSGKIDSDEKSLQKYLDELILREFAHKKDAPFWKELLGQLSDLTIVIPIYEAATGKTLITGDYLTDTEGTFKLVSATVSLVTLGQGALASKGGVAFAKLFAAEVVSEAAAGTTVIVCDKAGVPSAVTISLAMLLGTTAGMAANKALIPEDFSKWMTKEEASRYNQYWSDVQGRQGLKDYNYYGVLEDGYYKDLAVAGNYKNFDFSDFESSGNYTNIAQDKLNNIRSQMPNNDLAKRGNMAMADVKIEGIKSEFSAHSKIDSMSDKGANIADFSLKKSESERIFKTYEPATSKIGGKPFDRFHDTEAKILEDIASQIKDPKISGTIDLYTELPACQSCTNIIFEFKRKFPNIKLNVYTK